jgi:hypothetical protein
MLLKNVNVKDELLKEKLATKNIASQVEAILNDALQRDIEVVQRLKGGANNTSDSQVLNFNNDNIFTLSHIEKICIKYHLRFLDTKHFKSEFPAEAISAIHQFEREQKTTIANFKIIAPAKMFELEDANQDPLLFAQLSNNTFYLLHQWGNDLSGFRKYIYYPIRTIYTYFYSIIALAAIVACAIPFSWLQVEGNNEIYMRVWLTLHCTIGLFFFLFFIGATAQASFSSMSWNSRYFNE